MKNLYIANLMALFLFNTMNAQDYRNVYWAHGLAGNDTDWNAIRLLFNAEREMNGKSSDFPSFSGVGAARVNVVGDLNTLFGASGAVDGQNI